MATTPAEGSENAETADPVDTAVFKVAPAALLAAIFLALCLSPIAFQGGAWFLLFLIPVVVAVLVLRVRTTVDPDGLSVRTVTTTRLPWSQVATLRVADRAWVRAVPVEGARRGRELVLVNVRVRDLARVGEVSGGRIAVPTPADVEAAEEHRRELEAARMRVAKLREAAADTSGADTSGDDGSEGGTDGGGPAQESGVGR